MNINKQEVIKELHSLERSLGRRPTKHDSPRLYYLAREYFSSWNKMMKEAGYECKFIQKPEIPKELSPELCYFLGLVTTDGHIQYNKKRQWYNVSIYTSEQEEVDLILALIKKLFKYNSSIRERKSFLSERINHQINISSKIICEFLNGLGIPYGAKSYDITIPSSIDACERKYFWHYLRGVFDGDGSIIFSGNNHTFKISSGSVEFIKDIQKKLIKEGFTRSVVSRQKENVWEIKITNNPDLIKLYSLFYKEAEYFYPRKKLKWFTNMFKNASQYS